MDEWVPLNRIDVARGAVEEGAKGAGFGLDSLNGRERKVTRNLKRKHDEINHVQKVFLIYFNSVYAIEDPFFFVCVCRLMRRWTPPLQPLKRSMKHSLK